MDRHPGPADEGGDAGETGRCVACDRPVTDPWTCPGCGGIYCETHWLPEDHGCALGREVDGEPAVGPTGPGAEAGRDHAAGSRQEPEPEPEPGPVLRLLGLVLVPFLLAVRLGHGALDAAARRPGAAVATVAILAGALLVAPVGLGGLLPADGTAGEPPAAERATVTAAGGAVGPTDRDGDRLPDDREGTGALAAADPGHKDLYVRLVVGPDVAPVGPELRAAVREAFAGMAVRNPDGTTGIDVHHLGTVTADRTIRVGGDTTLSAVFADLPAPETEVPCRYVHTVAVGEVLDSRIAGVGATPGRWSVVDRTPTLQRSDTAFVGTVVHELLHNLVGERLDPDARFTMSRTHTTAGWLSGQAEPVGTNRYLSTPTQRVLDGGFTPLSGGVAGC